MIYTNQVLLSKCLYLLRAAQQVKIPPPEAVALFFALEGAPLLARLSFHRTVCLASARFPVPFSPAIAHTRGCAAHLSRLC